MVEGETEQGRPAGFQKPACCYTEEEVLLSQLVGAEGRRSSASAVI